MEFVDKDEIKSDIVTQKKRLDNIILKEDLKRYYIDEKKSMVEISEIYGCSDVHIRNKLKKYEIVIRPRGSSLVDDDGKTLYSKYINS